MSWFVVGGIAIGATAGAIVGSKKGGDDVWKDALIGGAIGGVGAGVGAAAFAPAAEAAVPAAVGAEGGAGILGAEGAVAGGSGLALGGAGLETGGAMAGGASGAGIMGAEGAATGAAGSSGMGLGQAGGFGSGATFGGSGTSFGTYGGATVPEGGGLLNAGFAPGMQAPIQMIEAPAAQESIALKPGESVTDALIRARDAGNPNVIGGAPQNTSMFDKALGWVEENPFKAGILGFTALGLTGALNKDNDQTFGGSTVTPAGYPLSPNFKPSRYQPTRTYAIGGPVESGMYPQSQIPDRTQFAVPTQMPASMEVLRSDYDAMTNPYTGQGRFAEGGKVDWNKQAQQFAAMTQAAESPASKEPGFMSASKVDPSDAGVFIDRDTETMDQPAHTAAQIRMQRLAKKYGVSYGPKTEEKEMAAGGITSLGGYAHGGNPRLLRGPGDGMSDDIPATIADKQPARLADGEFVVPADVVSGLGNGSTEAGAKKLHQMMDKVRVDRTGTKKQGKQIKADKYIPGMKAGGIASFADGGDIFVNSATNQIGYYKQIGSEPWEREFVPITAAAFMSQQATPSPTQATPSPTANTTANTTAQGYNPDYYNPQYYQNQLAQQQNAISTAQQNLANLQAIPTFNAAYYLQQNPDVAAHPDYGRYPYQHYLDYGIREGRSPYEGGQAGAQLQDPTAIAAAQQQLTVAQQGAASAQQNVDRLTPRDVSLGIANQKYFDLLQKEGALNPAILQGAAGSAELSAAYTRLKALEASPPQQQGNIAYSPYTIANRPSSAEPQFYGNIYKPEYENYARPDYNMNANLGQWSNIAGDSRAQTGAQLNNAAVFGPAYETASQSFANAQAAAQNAIAAQQPKQEKQEKQARKGGILAAKK